MTLVLDVQYAAEESADHAPSPEAFERWAAAVLRELEEAEAVSLTVRIAGEDEVRSLNGRYRGVEQPTNVLSFPMDLLVPLQPRPLGDIVLCGPLVRQEALAQGKPEEAHWAHLTVHGILHLVGYDHQSDDEARMMESLERHILAGLGYPDPYGGEADLMQE